MSSAFNGQNGTVKSGTVDMDVEGWSADVEANVIDVSTTADTGWSDYIVGLKDVKGSFDFFYNPAKKPTGASANLTPGATPTLTLQCTTGEVLTGTGVITKLSLKSKVKDAFKVTASFQSRGQWTLPS